MEVRAASSHDDGGAITSASRPQAADWRGVGSEDRLAGPWVNALDRTTLQLLERKVHRLFVVDGAGVLVGVVSATDVLQHLVPVLHS